MTNRKSHTKRFLATVLASSLICTQTLQIAQAAATDISDIPLAVRNLSQPNIMFMLDNSGSMNNIVPDSPYSSSSTYLATCPNPIDGGVATVISAATEIYDAGVKTDGTVRILKRIPTGNVYANVSDTNTYGTGGGEKCFNPSKFYYARLNANSSSTSSSADNCGTNVDCYYPNLYLASVYSGNYLNWYFGQSSAYASAENFGAGARRKSGTKTRMEVAIPTAKSVVDSLSNVRAGLSTYNSGNGGTLLEVVDAINATKKTALKGKIDSLVAGGTTPLAETLSDLGRYFTTGFTGNLTLHPGQSNQASQTIDAIFNSHSINNSSGVTTPAAPIQFFCQKSFAVMLTDGRPQQDRAISSDLRDYTGHCAAGLCDSTPNTTDLPTGALTVTTHQNGTKIGRNYEPQGSDYLDDVAKALYDIDLRPDLQPPTGSGLVKGKNNITTYTIGFADLQAINDPLLLDTATQGGGQRFLPNNSAQLLTAFQDALENILAVDGASAAVAVANANVTAGDNDSFASSYNSGTWTGDLQLFPINVSTGAVSTTATWSAQAKLNARTPTTYPTRYIASHAGGTGNAQGVQFQPTSASTTTKLSAAQQTLLNTPSTTDGAAVLAYLRGDRSGEIITTSTPNTYRIRAHLLADIINSEPVVVRKPNANYTDTDYGTFKTNQASRVTMVYQGANDGMLHAFTASDGAEEWAYIPNLVMANLNNLSLKTGFTHKYYVDGTPVAGDVDFSNTAGVTGNPAADWRTILVGGLNKGGRGYYALDITTPVLPSGTEEATLATKVLWEFPNSITTSTIRTTVTNNMGHSFGKPIIVKTQTQGWVALLTSGYNNVSGDGQGYLYVVNAKTGDLIEAISTGVGSAADPSGLAQISAYVENANIDNTVTHVYGGDLKGNVWRFDLTGAKNTWNVKKLATLVDASNAYQPVTTAPELAKITINGVDRYLVYVGTGLYLGDTDLSGISGITANTHATQTQTMYGLEDNRTNSPTITVRNNLVQQTINTTTGAASNNTVDYATKDGWYLDFPVSGERSFTDPVLALGALIFTTNTPSITTCVPGGSSKLYFLDYATGGFLTGSTVAYSFVSLGSALSSRPVLIKLGSGVVDALVRKSNKETVTTQIPLPASSTSTRRISWRELIYE